MKTLPEDWCIRTPHYTQTKALKYFRDTVIKYLNLKYQAYFVGDPYMDYYGVEDDGPVYSRDSWGTEITMKQFELLTQQQLVTESSDNWCILCTEENISQMRKAVFPYLNKIDKRRTIEGRIGEYYGVYNGNVYVSITRVNLGKQLTVEEFIETVLKTTDKTPVTASNLPKVWAVRNDGSQLFKDTVLAYINNKRKDKAPWIASEWNAWYGYDGTNFSFGMKLSWDSVPVQFLTIQEFQQLTTSNNQSIQSSINNQQQHGNTIKVQRPLSTVTTGQRPAGQSISGRTSRTAVTVGHLSYQKISY